jgi:hypothetical protein
LGKKNLQQLGDSTIKHGGFNQCHESKFDQQKPGIGTKSGIDIIKMSLETSKHYDLHQMRGDTTENGS